MTEIQEEPMEYMQGPDGFYVEGDTAVTMGKFDGLHRGHQKLIERIQEKKDQGCKSVVFTLNHVGKEHLLTTVERKEMAERLGVDCLIDCPLAPEISHMEPQAFVEDILVKKLHAKYLAVGTDFRFGYQRKGDYRLLQDMQQRYGFTVEVVEKEKYQGRDISSTYVREELEKGNMETVRELLGYPFFLSGRVSDRDNKGSGAMLSVETEKLMPAKGLYSALRIVNHSADAERAIIRGNDRKVYLADFDRDCEEGNIIQVWFLKRIRPEKECLGE